MDKKKKQNGPDKRLYTSILLFLVAVVCMSAATAAWFSIADSTRVNSINMQIISGTNLRFDLDPHETFDEYVKTLTFQQISERIKKEKNYDMTTVPLEPVTTQDAIEFTLEDGKVVKSDTGAYLEFTLHFMAAADMVVHLTSANTSGREDGTAILSKNDALIKAMRISFTVDDQTWIYDPGMGDQVQAKDKTRTFGLPAAGSMIYNDANALFALKQEVDQPVVVHVWLEGTDESCTNELKGAEYSIRLRFAGTDETNRILDGNERQEKSRGSVEDGVKP